MKKSLVALAALAASTAFAQSSVTLYGVADIWIGNSKVKVNGTGVGQNLMGSGGINGSRFGLRGSEDLGGGLKANFLFENGFNLDNGSAAQGGLLFGRQAYAGLSGGFGEVRFGRQYTAYDEARGGSDILGHSAFSPTANTVWSTGRAYTFRADNTWRYATPNFGGFSAALTYSLGENKTATTGVGNVIAAHAAYVNGPIAAFVSLQQEKNPAGAPAPNILNGGFALGGNSTKETHALISGSYDLGVVKLRAAYNQSKDNRTPSLNADKEFTFGVAAPLGPVTIETEVSGMKNAAEKSRGIGIQAKYNMSKRTFAYVGLLNAKNETIVTAPATSTVTKTNLIAVGLRHGF